MTSHFPCIKCGGAAKDLCGGCCMVAYCCESCRDTDWAKHGEKECDEYADEFFSETVRAPFDVVGVPGGEPRKQESDRSGKKQRIETTTTTTTTTAAEDADRAARADVVRLYWSSVGLEERMAFAVAAHHRLGARSAVPVVSPDVQRFIFERIPARPLLAWRYEAMALEIFDLAKPPSHGPVRRVVLGLVDHSIMRMFVPFEDVLVYMDDKHPGVTVAVLTENEKQVVATIDNQQHPPNVAVAGEWMALGVSDQLHVVQHQTAGAPLLWQARLHVDVRRDVFAAPHDGANAHAENWPVVIHAVTRATPGLAQFARQHGNVGPAFVVAAVWNHVRMHFVTVMQGGALALRPVATTWLAVAADSGGAPFVYDRTERYGIAMNGTTQISEVTAHNAATIVHVPKNPAVLPIGATEWSSYQFDNLCIVTHNVSRTRASAVSVAAVPTTMNRERTTVAVTAANGAITRMQVESAPLTNTEQPTTAVTLVDVVKDPGGIRRQFYALTDLSVVAVDCPANAPKTVRAVVFMRASSAINAYVINAVVPKNAELPPVPTAEPNEGDEDPPFPLFNTATDVTPLAFDGYNRLVVAVVVSNGSVIIVGTIHLDRRTFLPAFAVRVNSQYQRLCGTVLSGTFSTNTA